MNSNDIISSYNSLERNVAGISRLQDSWIGNVRSINNFVKSLLITNFVKTSDPVRVLDVACGKGGDFFKFKQIHKVVKYTGIDITPKSIEDFHERAKNSDLVPELFVQSATEPWSHNFDNSFTVMNVSFAFHYFWENEHTIRTFFENASRALRSGGRILITTPDAKRMREKIVNSRHSRQEYRVISSQLNLVARVTFVPEITTRGYLFHLKDSKDSFAVKAVEYFVNEEVLEILMNYYHFKMIFQENLYTFYQKNTKHPLMQHMNVPSEDVLDSSDISILELYNIMVLEKRVTLNDLNHNIEPMNVFESGPCTPPGTPPPDNDNPYDF